MNPRTRRIFDLLPPTITEDKMKRQKTKTNIDSNINEENIDRASTNNDIFTVALQSDIIFVENLDNTENVPPNIINLEVSSQPRRAQ